MYAESVIASTDPNRGIYSTYILVLSNKCDLFLVFWASGSINVPGGPQTPDQGGVTVDNNETPGCDAPGISCFPVKWKTFAEYLEDVGVSWQVVSDSFRSNGLLFLIPFIYSIKIGTTSTIIRT